MGGSPSNLTRRRTIPRYGSAESLKGSIILYGLPMSPNTQRVLVALAEKGLTYEFKQINVMESEHKSRKYMEGMQPFGLFPVLIDEDGFKIYESRAICRYLEEKYKGKGTTLIPTKDIKARFLFEEAAYIEAFNFDPPASVPLHKDIHVNYVHRILGRGEPDEIKIAQFKEELISKLDVYEQILSKQPYISGQTYTLADLFHLPFGALLFKIGEGDLIESRPNVKKWWEKISSRSSWKTVQAML